MSLYIRKKARAKVRVRIRKKISGTAERPRLAIHFSNQNVYAQLIDDVAGRTLAAASTLDKGLGAKGANKEAAADAALGLGAATGSTAPKACDPGASPRDVSKGDPAGGAPG